MALLHALLNTVLPVFLLAGLGWVARRALKIDVKDPAKLAVWFLTPGLIINSILTAQMSGAEVGKVVSFCLLLTGSMILITLVLGKVLGWDEKASSAAVLTSSFMNAANFGLPVILLAFGQAGFDRAAVYVVPSSIMMFTVAVYFAARGRMSGRKALTAVFKLPLVWAAGIALAIRLLGVTLPAPILKPINMLGTAAPVVMVIILGMQVATIQLKGNLFRISTVTVLRLLISPLVGMALVALLRPEQLIAKVLVLEAAMPASVNVTVVATEFGSEPEQVAGATLVTTILCLVSLTFWVWFLQGHPI
jgi:malate permease and related proteins